jgi:hypothetical protein
MRTLEDLHAPAARKLATNVLITVYQFIDGVERLNLS